MLKFCSSGDFLLLSCFLLFWCPGSQLECVNATFLCQLVFH